MHYKKIYIPGVPVIKQRHRVTKKGHVYDPNEDNETACISRAKLIEGSGGVFKGALEVEYTFVFPRPKSHYRTGKNSHLLRDDAPKFCDSVKKDIDNLEKFFADAFNCVHYLDDRQICIVARSVKRWAEDHECPHVWVTIRALEPDKEL